MEDEDSKKSAPNKTRKSSKNRIIDLWNKQRLKGKFLIVIIVCLGLISVAGISGALAPDKNAQKVDALNQIKVTLDGAHPVINDPYNALNAYKSGSMDANTVASKLEADKTLIDGYILQLQNITPPDELQHSHSSALSVLEDTGRSISLGIDGVNNNDSNKINQAIDLNNNTAAKFDNLADEVYTFQYSTD